jgi:hypothetical protein
MRRLILGVFITCFASMTFAGPVTYNITVDTSSINGTSGSLDFNFNPGPLITQAASVQIVNLATDGSFVGGPSSIGNVSGNLPATVTLANGTPFNDYFQGFTFGSTLSFGISLFGPALSAPDGTSTSGSAFAFSMFSDAAGTTPVLTTDTTNGFAVTVGVNLDGSTTLTNFIPGAAATPEPGTGAVMGLALTFFGLWRRRQIRSRKAST